MNGEPVRITVDGRRIETRTGLSVLEACDGAGIYIPRLCYHPDLKPGGHCRLCTSKIDGRFVATCLTPVADGMVIQSDTPELNEDRKTIVDMLFVEGNHFCPACEKSGDCELQAMAYRLGLDAPRLTYLWKMRELDATHPEVYLDRNRCILCCRCVRASRDIDGKSVFGLEGRGGAMRIGVNAAAGLGATDLAVSDKAVEVCPVASIVRKGHAFETPFGQRRFDRDAIGSDIEARSAEGERR